MKEENKMEELLQLLQVQLNEIQNLNDINKKDKNLYKYIKESLLQTRKLIERLIKLNENGNSLHIFQSINYLNKLKEHQTLLNQAEILLLNFRRLDSLEQVSQFLKFKIQLFEIVNKLSASLELLTCIPIAQQPVLTHKPSHIRSRTLGEFSYSMLNYSDDRRYTFLPNNPINAPVKNTNNKPSLTKKEEHPNKRNSLPLLTSSIPLTRSLSKSTSCNESQFSADSAGSASDHNSCLTGKGTLEFIPLRVSEDSRMDLEFMDLELKG